MDKSSDGIARVAINRPEKRNAFRPKTIDELIDAFIKVKYDEKIGVVLFTGVAIFRLGGRCGEFLGGRRCSPGP